MKRRAVLAVIPALFACPQAMAAKLDIEIANKASHVHSIVISYLNKEAFYKSELTLYPEKEMELRAKLTKIMLEFDKEKKDLETYYQRMRTHKKIEALKEIVYYADRTMSHV